MKKIIKTDLAIVGSGPAGLTAGIYSARANFKPVLLAGEIWGGQLMKTTDVENFPGFPEGISGPILMENMMKQAEKFGTKVLYENVTFVDLKNETKVLETYNTIIKAKSVILATGSTPRRLNIKGEEQFYGRGVSTCATCDAAFYKQKTVAVVGGGDSAMQEANFLTKFAKKVYLIHRKDTFRASKIMQDRVFANPNITVIFDTEVLEVKGDQKVQNIDLYNNKTKETSTLEIDGVFLAIGHIPVTGFLKDSLSLDEQGYVLVEANSEVLTNIKGVFVAGEVSDHEYRQAITSASAGCKASLEATKYLDELNQLN